MSQQELQSFANWLVNNADKKGTPEFDTVAQAFKTLDSQQGGQQQTQPQQDERSLPRAIADVGGNVVAGVPKAFGALVGAGSQIPLVNKVTDPVAESLTAVGNYAEHYLVSDVQKQKNKVVAAAIDRAVADLGEVENRDDIVAYVIAEGGAAADAIMEDPSQIPMLTAQALPYMLAGGWAGKALKNAGVIKNAVTAAAIGEGTVAMGAVTNDIVARLKAKGIEGYTPDRLAALPAGVLTALLGRLGGKVNTKLGSADVDTAIVEGLNKGTLKGISPKGAAISATTEAGEEFLQSAQEQAFTNVGAGDPAYEGVGSSAVQGAAAGFGMGSVIGSNVFNRDGNLRNPTDLQIAQRAAAGDVARSLRKTAEDNEYNLGDIDPTSGYGAKQALEDYRRGQVTGIVNLVKSLKNQLNPKQAQTLEQLLQDYVPAEAGITAAKRKVSAKVTTDQFDAVKRLVAGTQEGDTLLQELQKSNIVTDLFKDGMKGGVSKFTDLFNPLMTSGQSYDPTRVGNVVVGGLPLLSTGGQSLIPQAAIVLGGQAIDKVLGGKGGTRRKLVERFVKLNEDNDGLGRPTGPSLIAQAQQAERQEEQEAESSAALKEAVRRFRSERGGPEPDSAPLGMLYMGTGLDRSGLEQLLPHLEQHYGDRPEVTELINQTRRNLAGENNQITGLTDWISILNSVLSSDATIDGLRIADPDGSDARNQRRKAGFGPSASQSSAGTAQQQPQVRSPAVQSGIDDNRAQLEKLRQGLAANKSLTPAERGRLLTALDELQYNLGSEPAVAAMDVVSRLKSDGINESLINRHIMPYVERVLRQQARSGRRQQPPTSTGTDLAFDEDFDASQPALNAGQSFDQDLAQQGNTGVLATPPAQQPQPQSPFNMASLVNKMLGSQPATPEQVKAQLPVVRPVFEIGKAGTKYADGIQDIDSAIEFAKAINVTLKLFDSQQEMFDALGYPLQDNVRGAYRKKARVVFGMNPNAKASDTLGEVTTLDSLTTVLHELGHAVAKDSGFESIIDRMMQDNSEYSDNLRKRVFKEIDNIQRNIDLYLENKPTQRRPVRRILEALQARKIDPSQTPQVNRYLAYVNRADERAVDPVLLYFVNPRLAKAVAPITSRLVKESLNAAGNQDFQLYTYPFATMVAVVLAMMLNGRAEEEEEEKQRQQMPAGALSPQAGALSQQQQFAA